MPGHVALLPRPGHPYTRPMLTCPSCGRESSEEFAFCPFCGAALGAPAAGPAEVRKTVTVVFCDVTGSTSLGERLDPETLRGVMRRYFEEMTTAIERHGGTVEKFIGDAVMAVFGVPTLHEDDAVRAVRAAEDMRTAMRWLNKELERDHGVTLQIRIGVNTGEVVARQEAAAGSQGLVSGDAVNVAARFEQTAAPGEIVLGDATYRLVRDAVEVEPLEPLDLKGKGEPVPAHRLVLIHPHAAGIARRLDSPMIGRSRPLRQLSEAFRTSVEERACYLFTVLGAPGVGKSRLTEEFLASVRDEATVLRGRCLSYGQGITFFPLVEILGQLGLSEIEPEPERGHLVALLGGGTEAEAAADRLLSLTGAVETSSASEELFWAARRLFESLAAERPLVVVIDDIHWAEPTLLDLVEHVADWARESPILLVCPARPELLDIRPNWGGGKTNATTILLEPLSETECEELVENLLGSTELEGAVRRRIAESAEGNPLFVEQMLAMLIDDGALEQRDGSWAAVGDLAGLTVPPSVQALLTARLDRLPAAERRVLERAAVEGKEFSTASASALLDEPDRVGLSEHLRALVRREFVRPQRSERAGLDAYRFRHQLIRDAAYESIPKRDRAELHRRFAGWFGDHGGEFAGERSEIIGYHLEQSYLLRASLGPVDDDARADGVRAAEMLAAAARRAMDRGDVRAAENLLSRAMVLVPRPDPRRIRIAIDLAEALRNLSRFRETLQVLDEAAEDARSLGDEVLHMVARLVRANANQSLEERAGSDEQLRLGQEAVDLFRRAGEPGYEATAWQTIANAHWENAQWGRMREPLERAIDVVRRTGDRGRELEFSLRLLSGMFYGQAPTSEGIGHARMLMDEAPDHPLVRGRAAAFLGALLGFRGQFDEGWRMIDLARQEMEKLGPGLALVRIGFASAALAVTSGRLDEGEADIRRGLDILRGTGERGQTATLAAVLAFVLIKQGRIDEAEPYADHARETALPSDINAEYFWRTVTGIVLAKRGDLEGALALLREAIEINARTDEAHHRADFLIELGDVARMAERRDEARKAFGEALEIYERKEHLVGATAARGRLDALGS